MELDMLAMAPYGLFAIGMIALFLGIMIYQANKNYKFSKGKLKCYFRAESGRRYYKFLPIELNGIEIKAPSNHTCPRYFFNRTAVFTELYPDNPPLGQKGLQREVECVEWRENDPEPIVPGEHDIIATATLIGATRDEDFAGLLVATAQHLKEIENKNTLNGMIVYALLAVAAISGIAGAVMTYQIGGMVKLLTGG